MCTRSHSRSRYRIELWREKRGKNFYQEQNHHTKNSRLLAALKTWKSDKFFPIIRTDKKRRERSLREKEEPKSWSAKQNRVENQKILVFFLFSFTRSFSGSRMRDQQFWCHLLLKSFRLHLQDDSILRLLQGNSNFRATFVAFQSLFWLEIAKLREFLVKNSKNQTCPGEKRDRTDDDD